VLDVMLPHGDGRVHRGDEPWIGPARGVNKVMRQRGPSRKYGIGSAIGMPGCIIVQPKAGAPRAYVFPDRKSARAWYDQYQERWNEGGNIVFHTPTQRGPFITAYGPDRIADLRLAHREDIDEAGIAWFDAVFLPAKLRAERKDRLTQPVLWSRRMKP
jgi:hypothetical protein